MNCNYNDPSTGIWCQNKVITIEIKDEKFQQGFCEYHYIVSYETMCNKIHHDKEKHCEKITQHKTKLRY